MKIENLIILFVPGAWHFPAGFATVRSQLETLGYSTAAVAHPSIGAEPPNKTLADDTTSLRSAITSLADDGKKIVVVTHSYGGVVGSCAVEDLGYAQRQTAGKEGGVINLVYMTAFALPTGVSLLDALGGVPLPWMNITGNYTYAEDPADIFYNDLDATAQQYWISQLSWTSTPVFSGKSTYEPWNYMPCTYIHTLQDKAIPIATQQAMSSTMGNITEFTIDSSHSPFLSQPAKLVEGIELAITAGMAAVNESATVDVSAKVDDSLVSVEVDALGLKVTVG